MNKRVYMDYNATAPLRPEAREAALQAMESPHNASAVHRYGREGRALIESARKKVAALTNAQTSQVIFNSGATEGNNTVLKHFAGKRVLISAIEHASVQNSAQNPEFIPVTTDGVVNLETLETLLKQEQTSLVSVMLVNNETGVIQPIAEISALAKKHGALVHCDAVQAAGHIDIDISALGIDFLTLSGHKIGAPQGIGALVFGLCGVTPTLLHGTTQEKKARAGTENVAGISGFGVAAELAKQGLASHPGKLNDLKSRLEKGLCATNENTIIYGADVARAASTTMFSMPGTQAHSILMALDLEGIAVSNGSACSSGSVRHSPVLNAMGVSEDEARSAVRVSIGWATTENDIDCFIEAWNKVYSHMQNKDQAAHA